MQLLFLWVCLLNPVNQFVLAAFWARSLLTANFAVFFEAIINWVHSFERPTILFFKASDTRRVSSVERTQDISPNRIYLCHIPPLFVFIRVMGELSLNPQLRQTILHRVEGQKR